MKDAVGFNLNWLLTLFLNLDNEAALTFSAHLRLHHPIHIAQIPNVQYKEARIRIALTASASALSLVDAFIHLEFSKIQDSDNKLQY